MATIDSVVDFLSDTAEDALRTAREVTSRIQGGGVVPLNSISLDFEPNAPVLAPPPTFSDLFPGSDSTATEVQRLDAEVDKWIDKYFPEINACLRDSPEQWLCKIISGSDPFADSKAIMDILWHEARDRAYRTSNSETQTIHATYSERGFTLPVGVAVRLGVESQVRASQAIADVNRTQTTEMLRVKVDLLKFAEEQAIRLKLGVMDALRAFYVAWVSLPDKDIERSRIRAQAQASLYGALSSYYNVQLGFEQLRLRAAEADVDAQLGVDRNKIAAYQGNQSAGALADAVRGFTDVTSSAASAQSALIVSTVEGA
ncbi:hypothetical protein [Pseudomonas phage Rollin]|nr:hypothetical protein [Pseudomonas phage Rollin]